MRNFMLAAMLVCFATMAMGQSRGGDSPYYKHPGKRVGKNQYTPAVQLGGTEMVGNINYKQPLKKASKQRIHSVAAGSVGYYKHPNRKS